MWFTIFQNINLNLTKKTSSNEINSVGFKKLVQSFEKIHCAKFGNYLFNDLLIMKTKIMRFSIFWDIFFLTYVKKQNDKTVIS